ncbi:kinase-like domain-containing protein [Gilbertella persicaria]|uniref:kinase-like domain-containing protein n=1 Tax=Gilbertella persicaria TaxID=101096 RepID=UPI002220760E|nr:kinase-like domain-containing protein [Gilbertella persicaria]KAI8087019.1 kinase-like domain-containing protein [Gilbertella persicaria]
MAPFCRPKVLHDTLREQLEWLDIKLQHHIRLDVLKDCHKEGDILSIEELRAKHDRYHLVRSCPRIIHPAHALVVQLPHRPGLIDQQIQTHSTEHYTVFDHDASFIQRQLDAWFQTTKHNKKQAKQDLKLIQLSQDKFHVVRKINEGGMAHIYLVQNYLSTMLVLKIQQPAHAWEYYILSQLKQRAINGFHLLGLHGFYRFTDRSFLIMDYVRHGTLLDALNLYRPQHNAMPESVVLLLTLQLLKQLYLLHWQMSITHNDLKLDNVMVCLSDQDMVGIMLVDYGYAIDTRIIGGHHTLCKANWPPACPASDFPLLNKAYYPVHADYWQLATMVHWLLFGCPMRTLTEKHSYRIQQKIKRYWHRQLWNRFFQFMLNPPVPKQDAIRSLLSQFEMIVYQDVFENNKSDLKAFVALLLDKHRVDER